jgi:hypothetical protein
MIFPCPVTCQKRRFSVSPPELKHCPSYGTILCHPEVFNIIPAVPAVSDPKTYAIFSFPEIRGNIPGHVERMPGIIGNRRG